MDRPRLTAEHVQPGGVPADAGHHICVGMQVLVSGQFPERVGRLGIDSAGQAPEGGVGIDGHDAILPAQFGEDRSNTGGDRRLADAALAQHADLVVAVQDRPDGRFELDFLALRDRRTRPDKAKGDQFDDAPPAAVGAQRRAGAYRPRESDVGPRTRWG